MSSPVFNKVGTVRFDHGMVGGIGLSRFPGPGWRPLVFGEVGIIGVGLLGGSLALALKQRGLARTVIGISTPNYPAGQRDLESARRRGVVDQSTSELGPWMNRLDVVVVCTPVDCIADHAHQALPFLSASALVTDVGSTKANIVRALERWRPGDQRFVGSHPMAGSDRSGPEAASSQLFAGRNCIVTPTAHTSQETKRRAAEMWQALGMTVLYRSPEEHDRIVSRTSHLPHVAAAALTSLIDPEDRPFVGAGLRDTTRIAGGSPEIWTAILQNNRESLLAALDELRSELNRVESALMTDDRRFLLQWLDDAKRNRDALGG